MAQEVLLELLGREFIIKSASVENDKLQEAVNLLTNKVNQLNQDIPNQGLNRILVLAALNFIVENLQLKDPKQNPNIELKDKISQLQTRIQTVLNIERS